MNKRLLILFLSVIYLLSFVSAQGTQNRPYDIIHTVTFGDIPTTTALCNITVKDPEEKILVDFKSMTSNSASKTYNYTLPSSNTSKEGQYCYDISCTQSGLNNTLSNCVDFNPTGGSFSTAQSLIYIFVLILSIFFLGLFIIGSFKYQWSNDKGEYGEIINIQWQKYFKLFCMSMAYVTALWISYVTYNISLGYLQLLAVANFFRFIYWFMLVMLTPMLTVFIVVTSIKFVRDLQLQKLIDRGVIVEGLSGKY